MKNGFTLIELIFTIVILAITTMAIPRMVAQTAELNILAIQQELVENAKTAVVQVAKAPWDGAYVANEAQCQVAQGGDPDFCFVPTKIHTVVANAGVNVPLGNNRILGIVEEAGESRQISTANPTSKANFGSKKDKASAVSFGKGLFNDIDDYDASFVQTVGPTAVGGNTEGDFILNTRLSVAVDYLNEPNVDYVGRSVINGVNFGFDRTADINNDNPTNIKLVEVTATDTASTDPNRSIILRYYAFNIGTSIIREKDF